MEDAATGIRETGRALHALARLPRQVTGGRPPAVMWAHAAADGVAAARRAALGDPAATPAVTSAYATIGRSLRG
jgi:hypothetical protein